MLCVGGTRLTGRRFLFDCETDGLLDELTTIHSLVLKDIDTGERVSCADQPGFVPVEEGVRLLEEADLLVGHNILRFDIQAVQKVFPRFAPKGQLRDTLVMTRVAWPDTKVKDAGRGGDFPKKLVGSHSLEAWGRRLGILKDDYQGDPTIEDPKVRYELRWSSWNPTMQSYCEQDVEVTGALWTRVLAEELPEECWELEHAVARIIGRQEDYGFLFDPEIGEATMRRLMVRQAELRDQLMAAFPPWEVRTPFVPKANNKKLGYQKGVPTFKVTQVVFNPDSRQHLADRLKALHGWEPDEFTGDGRPKLDEEVLGKLPYPEAKLVSEYLIVAKRIGQMGTGKEALLKKVRADGRIHGRVNPNGAHTGRMTHSGPNVAQVPTAKVPYHEGFRQAFTVPPGKVLVGCDADALELRCLAHFMARYDGGAYIETVLRGDKALGTDMHSVNCRAIGLDPKKLYPLGEAMISGREMVKTWFYAFLYGAGNQTLGENLGVLGNPEKAKRRGGRDRARIMQGLPALGELIKAVQERVSKRGYLTGLDGRKLRCRSKNAALNTLLQSAGALAMKKALVILDGNLMSQFLHAERSVEEARRLLSQRYEFVANVHDEWQIECDEDIAEDVGKLAADAIRLAGEHFKFRCPLAGQFHIGRNWAETH